MYMFMHTCFHALLQSFHVGSVDPLQCGLELGHSAIQLLSHAANLFLLLQLYTQSDDDITE